MRLALRRRGRGLGLPIGLAMSEDDVRATWHLRRWLRTQD